MTVFQHVFYRVVELTFLVIFVASAVSALLFYQCSVTLHDLKKNRPTAGHIVAQACPLDTLFCPIPWQLVTFPSHWIPTKLVIRSTICRPVTRGGEATLETFLPPLEKGVGYSLKMLDIVQKLWAPLRKLFAPPGVSSWLRA